VEKQRSGVGLKRKKRLAVALVQRWSADVEGRGNGKERTPFVALQTRGRKAGKVPSNTADDGTPKTAYRARCGGGEFDFGGAKEVGGGAKKTKQSRRNRGL